MLCTVYNTGTIFLSHSNQNIYIYICPPRVVCINIYKLFKISIYLSEIPLSAWAWA